ncbi:MAG: hypothetical protein GWP91_17175 [Rhodobacterales bacterium]|nr:hypothetical protein [Rhodobacterales bacterium]
MAEAPELEALYQRYEAEGFIVITMIGENLQSESPSQADLVEWADSLGLSHPVVADPGMATTFSFVEGNSVGLPSMTLIAAGGEILYADDWLGESEVSSNLP